MMRLRVLPKVTQLVSSETQLEPLSVQYQSL